MNLWSFIFTDQNFPVVSARIAAPTKNDAAIIAKERIIGETPIKPPILSSHMGRYPSEITGVLQIIYRGHT